MISPNCTVIMDATSTTSAFNPMSRNAESARMHSNVGDQCGMDGLNENEPLEGPGQDPDDEDTLSDDSLRLRLSDDEADARQPCTNDKTSVTFVSSEQTTSKDTVTGLTKSDEKVSTNRECQKSKHRSLILSETHVGGKKNLNSMWRGGNRREHSSNNIIHSPKMSLRGQSRHMRHSHSHSSIHRIPSYFNNHDNFGKPQGYSKYKNNWRNSKGKYSHGHPRNMQKSAVKEQALNSCKSESRSNSNTEVEISASDQSPVHLTDSLGEASSNAVDNDSTETVTCQKEDKNSEQTVNKINKSLPSVNDELSRECRHLNLDRDPTLASKNNDDSNLNHNAWKNHGNISNYCYDSRFTSDNWFDEPHSKTSSPLMSQSPSNFEGLRFASPIRDIEPTVVRTEKKNVTAIDDRASSQSSNISSPDLTKNTSESDDISKSNDIKLDSNSEADATCDIPKEIESNAPDLENIEESDEIVNSSPLPKSLSPELKLSDESSTNGEACSIETKVSENRGDENVDEIEKGEDKENSTRQDLSGVEDTEEAEDQQAEVLACDVTNTAEEEESMEIPTETKEDDIEKEVEKAIPSDTKRRDSSDEKPIKFSACAPESPKEALEKMEEENENRLQYSETSNKLSDDSELKLTAKSSLKPNGDVESKSENVMKRSLPDAESVTDKTKHKKIKISHESGNDNDSKPSEFTMTPSLSKDEKPPTAAEESLETPKPLQYVRKFFQRDMKGKLAKLKRGELEELIIQKLVETITMRSEIGRLREQARISERNQEATRVRCQQLAKQIKDFDMVLTRNATDRRANNDKFVPPIKINRSVGLQVNLVTEHGIQSLRALTTNHGVKAPVPNPVVVNGAKQKIVAERINHVAAMKRGVKVRSPRRAEVPKNSQAPVQTQAPSTATPTAIVISKPADTSHNISNQNNNKEHHVSATVNVAQASPAKMQNIVVNGKISYPLNRQTIAQTNQKPPGSNDLIDLTEEEDKNRSGSNTACGILPMIGTVTSSIGGKVPQSRFPRVVTGAIPTNVAITTQPANIRVVHSVAQPTPTALVNNINTTRLAYVMQGGQVAGRQLLIAPNPNQIRPAVSTTRAQYSNVTYKSGISTLANGNVRVITTAAPTPSNLQPPPAPPPETPHYPAKSGWKLPPPPPSLKISKVTQGIVLSWNMAQSDSYAEIASYQLYAYQEIPGTPPNSNLWKKVGDVRALPLPMACTLKEFTPGNNYHFAVRAVDKHSRLGQYSVPRNISL